jgi:hypothetical protein
VNEKYNKHRKELLKLKREQETLKKKRKEKSRCHDKEAHSC